MMRLSGTPVFGLVSATALAMASLAPGAAQAQAPAARRSFNMAPQPADKGLVRFAQQAGIQILAPATATRGAQLGGLRGQFTVEEGLRRLIAPSRLHLVSFDGRTAVLTGDDSAAARPAPGFRTVAFQNATPPVAAPAGAGASPAPTSPPGAEPAAEAPAPMEEIIVTGNTSGRRTVFTSSSNVTLANTADIQRKAPRSTADVLELVPGVFVEGTAGPVSNNYSVRGLRGGGQTFIALEEDGMPILYGGAGADIYFQNDITIDRVEAVEGGTSGVLAVNGAAATINFISLKPSFTKPVASVRFTGTTYGDYRADGYFSAPLTDSLAFSLGGYVDSTRGVRSSPFIYNTYHVKAMLEKRFAGGGFVRLTARRGDEHDPYYADMPFAVSSSGKIGGVPGLDPKYANIGGPGFANILVPDSCATGACQRRFSLSEGIHTRTNQIRLDLEAPVTDGVTLFARARYLDAYFDFNGIFAGSGAGTAGLASASAYLDPARSPIAGFLGQGLVAFPGTTQFGIRDTRTGRIIPASDTATLNALNGNGLLQQTVLNHQTVKTRDFGSDFGARWDADMGALDNSLTVGGMVYNVRRYNDQSGVATLINDVTDQSNIYDIVALGANGAPLGQLSNNGMISYGNWGQGVFKDEVTSVSGYFNDELKIGTRLHVDFGARYERQHVRVDIGDTAPVNQPVPAGTPGIVADVGSTFAGTYTRQSATYDDWAATAGVNYTLTDNIALYARYARGFQTFGGDTGGTHKPSDLTLYEGGVRFQSRYLSASVIGFRTIFKNQSYQFINPDNPAVQANALANNKTSGVQFDASLKPVSFFSLTGQGVYQDPKLNNLRFDGVAQPQYEGNTPERTPKLLFTLTPAVILPDNRGEIYLRYKHIGKIYADSGNGVALPSYGVITIGGSFNVTPRVNVNVSVDNLTNVNGFTEGNPRQGQTQSIVGGYFYGRSIVGRNALVSMTVKL
ncbi:TonB-dependent siderophore receptor [Sphingomonas morindae]|uniref:TonB-dependent receptor n=1 Tax=Sphingomonas morindae TaxID=1541170 RepID=A0ABY4XCY9_9SPHN|nr:TonB-dependent receptor [Sphingomonas morindae]USI74775.1 TonB-dependent receptor [Sphingomonas morindae]